MAKPKVKESKPENAPVEASPTPGPTVPVEASPATAAPDNQPELPRMSAPVAASVEPGPAPEPEAAVAPVVETGDESAPYGRDDNGKPLAPYGFKSDGVTPAKKRGRKGAAAEPVTVEAKPAGDPKRERKRSISDAAIDTGLAAIREATAEGDWFSAEADAARCQRARQNAPHWIGLAELVLEQGETAALGILARGMVARDRMSPEKVAAIVAKIPPMRKVTLSLDGKPSNVLAANAEALAFILAYFLPYKPSHPLLRAGVALVIAQMAYARAIREAFAVEARPV